MDFQYSKYASRYYTGEDSDCVARFIHPNRAESYSIYRSANLILVVHSVATNNGEEIDESDMVVRLEAIIPYSHRKTLLELCNQLTKEGYELCN